MKRIALITLALVLITLSVCACTDKHHSGFKEETTETVTSFETDPIETVTSFETDPIETVTSFETDPVENVTSFETDPMETVQTAETEATPETTVKDEKPQYTVEELAEVLHLSSTMLSVLSNEAKLRDTDPIWKDKEFVYLQYLVRYNFDKICIARAFDLDEDGINEVVILDGGLTIVVLREYEGTVYGRKLALREMYNLRIDGTYDWDGREEDVLTYATSKLNFNGADWNPIELKRYDVDINEENERYYIGGTEVTKEEYKVYMQHEDVADKAEWYILMLNFETGV